MSSDPCQEHKVISRISSFTRDQELPQMHYTTLSNYIVFDTKIKSFFKKKNSCLAPITKGALEETCLNVGNLFEKMFKVALALNLALIYI